MTTRIRFLLILIIALHNLYVNGQWTCAFDEVHAKLMSSDSKYQREVQQLNKDIYNYTLNYSNQKTKNRAKAIYTLPVVVHIISPPGTAIGQGNNLTNLQVEQGLNYLNQAFSNSGPFNTANGVDVGIQFCLARRDPNGQPTNGITRDESPLVNDMMCNPGTNSSNDGQIKMLSNWDCNQYINIWLVTDLFNANFGCGLAGYAYFPGAPCTVDGIVQESRYWNSIGGTAVTAHEVGHYFSLNHTFNGGCANSDCLLDGDQICDTPPDNSPSFAPCNTNSCNTDLPDLPDDNTNYMDYTSCGPVHFTDGQRVRMIAGLEMRRSSLIQSKGCLQVGDYDASIIDLKLDDVCSDMICAILTIRNEGQKSFSFIFIDYSLDGVAQPGFLWNGNLNTNQSAVILIPCIPLTVGNHNLNVTLGKPDNQTDFFLSNNSQNINFNSYEALKIAVDSITPTHCASDGTITISVQGGTSPYSYKISNHSYSQTDPYFQLLLSGNYTITVTDANLCEKTIDLVVPDSCKTVGNDSFRVNRDARSLGNDCYILTQALSTQAGSVWYEQKANLNESFDVYFDMNLGCIDALGADGIAFVFQPISTSIGVAGGGLGYQGITPSLDVEFDTYQNQQYNDPGNDHIAIMKNGVVSHFFVENLAGPVSILPFNLNAEDCNFHKVLIRWNANTKTIEVYVDCIFRLRYTGDIVNTIFNGDPNVYFGFTAATGSAVNVQQICYNYATTVNKLEDYTICKGEAVQVNAASKFQRYKWSPSTGINKTDIKNPVLDPDSTTTYYLEQTDFCGFKYFDTLTIFVKQPELKYELTLNDSCGSFSGALLRVLSNIGDTSVSYSIDGKYYTRETVFQIGNPGTYTLYAKIGNCLLSEVIKVTGYQHKLRDSLLLIQAVNCKDSGRIVIIALEGIPPYQFRINNGSWQNDGIFDQLPSGNYTIDIKDQTSCSIGKNVQINRIINKIWIQTDSSQLKLNCCTPDPYISVNASGSVPFYYYSLDNLSWTSEGLFTKLSPGKHKIVARDEFGCVSDSLDFEVIDEMISSIDTMHVALCQGEFFQVGSDQYTTTGVYSNSFKNIYCCDSVIITDLIVHPKYSMNNAHVICDGEEIAVGSKKYTFSGNYIDTLQSMNSCDSIVFTNLVVNPVYRKNQNLSICQGSIIQVGNNTYAATGDYIDTLQTVSSCDSIINTHLIVNAVFSEIQNHSLCKGQSLTVDQNRYDRTGIYIDTLTTSFGCDSIIKTQLFIDTVYASLTIDSILCFQDDNGRITVTPQRGIPDFKFAIDQSNYSDVNVFDQLVPGNYTLYLKDSLGCSEAYTVTLFQPLELQSNLTSEINIKLGERIIFDPQLNFVPITIQWTPDTGLSCTDCLYPEVQPLRNIEYEVIFTNEYDCELRARVKINVDNNTDIYIPNVFSPNGDQINDRFIVYGGESIQEVLVMSIYNRWGELVFENHNFQVNDFQAAWDGNMKGEKLNPGVFVYYLKAIRIDGSEIVKKGDVTLLR